MNEKKRTKFSIATSPIRCSGMHETYTLTLDQEGREEIVARGLTLRRALIVALEHGGRCKAALAAGLDVGEFCCFTIGRCPTGGTSFERILDTLVLRSGDLGFDAERAMEAFGEILLDDTRIFWNGRIERDQEYASRSAGGDKE